MKKLTQEEADLIVAEHEKWLESKSSFGTKADFSNMIIEEIIFCNAKLNMAIFTNAHIKNTKFSNVDLFLADFSNTEMFDGLFIGKTRLDCVSFKNASIYDTNFSGFSLNEANFTHAKINNCFFIQSDLCCSSFLGATFISVEFTKANLAGVEFDEKEKYRFGEIIKEPMTGWKICINEKHEKFLVKLEIPKSATVFCINGRKCRTNHAIVKEIVGADRAYSSLSGTYLSYYEGDEMFINDFDCRYNIECSMGIHFFKNKDEALIYGSFI